MKPMSAVHSVLKNHSARLLYTAARCCQLFCSAAERFLILSGFMQTEYTHSVCMSLVITASQAYARMLTCHGDPSTTPPYLFMINVTPFDRVLFSRKTVSQR